LEENIKRFSLSSINQSTITLLFSPMEENAIGFHDESVYITANFA
jgi:hypothetical protein